jgi:tRNA threonylcarbamoyladenosine biosynthesis protein TsaB
MRVLAIDTTSAFGSIALLEGERLIEEIPIHSPDGFGHVLFDHIRRLLHRHDWSIDSIGCFSAAAGPGSFTGVRIGLSAAKGLAEATGARAAGVSNLEALASFGSGALRAVVMDARRGEVYGAVYDDRLRIVGDEVVTPFPVWLHSLPAGVSEVISPDFTMFHASFTLDVPVIEQRAIAAAVGRIAERTGGSDPAAIDANYVRRSDAELNWTEYTGPL